MKTIILTMFSIFFSASAVLKTEQDNAQSLTSCVVKMVKNIDYKKHYHLMDITVMNMNNDLQLSALHNVNGARFVSRKFFWDPGNIGNVIYIMMSADYQELERGLSKVISDKFWNPLARFIIILQSYENHSLHNITNLLQAYNIFYKVSLISRGSGDYAIYQYNFTKPGYCFKTGHLTFWSRCSDYCTEKKLPVLYKGSIRNCRYKFISRNIWPFMNFDTSTKGTEQYFITVFQKQFGVKIDLQEFTKFDKYGRTTSNLTMKMLRKVENDEVEGALGGYDISSLYSGNISHSYPITIDHIFYIAAHANFVGQWVAVVRQSFGTCVIIGFLFVIFCVAATFLSIFPPQKDVSRDVLVVFGYLLNTNVVKRTESGWPQTLVFSTLLFTAFIIPYAIQANLFSVTTQPVRGYEPKKRDDLKKYQAVLHTDWPHRHEFHGHWDCGARINCLMKVKYQPNKSLYTVISNSHYKIYQYLLTDDHCKMTMYRLKEPYSSIYRTIYLRRGSALIEDLNSFTLQFATTGLMAKYASDLYFREWLKCKSHYRPGDVPLPLENFYYVFMMLISGYCLSLLIFIYEVCSGSQHSVSLTRAQWCN